MIIMQLIKTVTSSVEPCEGGYRARLVVNGEIHYGKVCKIFSDAEVDRARLEDGEFEDPAEKVGRIMSAMKPVSK